MGGCVDGVSGDVVGDFFPVRFTRLFFTFSNSRKVFQTLKSLKAKTFENILNLLNLKVSF